MSLDKRNSYLLPDVCEVYLKSVTGSNPFSDFEKIYGIPSKIKYSYSSRLSKVGLSYKYNLSMIYPGLSEIDFDQFNILLKDQFEIKVKKSDKNTYSLSSNLFPFRLSTKFNSGKGTVLTFKTEGPVNQKINLDGVDLNLFLSSAATLSSTNLLNSAITIT